MDDKQRIAELEKRLAELEPTSPALLKVNGKKQEIVSRFAIIGIRKGKGFVFQNDGTGELVKAVPVLVVKDSDG